VAQAVSGNKDPGVATCGGAAARCSLASALLLSILAPEKMAQVWITRYPDELSIRLKDALSS
jgi:hypothetical protein